jgi:hypothetical protein
MRRNIGVVLLTLGVFWLSLALLIHFYVEQRLILAPTNVYQRTTLQANNATYLDTASFQMRHGATITAVNTLRGDVGASDGKIAVWDSFTSVEDTATKAEIDIQLQRVAFDRHTATLQNIRGAAVGGDASVRQSGIGQFWPIGIKKRTYWVFDFKTRRTWPMTFAGEGRIHGVKAYRFVQRITPTATGPLTGGVPTSLLGMKKPSAGFPGYDSTTGNVAVDRVYQGTITMWVEPQSGARLDQEQQAKTLLRTKDGVDRLVVSDMDLKMSDATQKDRAQQANKVAFKVALVRRIAPLTAACLGVVLLAAGLLLLRRSRRPVTPEASEGEAIGSSPSGSGSLA